MRRIRSLRRSLLSFLGLSFVLLTLGGHTGGQDIIDGEFFEFDTGVVEGVSELLAIDSSEIDTYSATFISFDLLDNFYEAYVEGYLSDNGSLIDSDNAFDDGAGEAQLELIDSVTVGDTYDLESDHYVIDDLCGDFILVGQTAIEDTTGAPNITNIDPTSAFVEDSGPLTIDGENLVDIYSDEIIVVGMDDISLTVNSVSPDNTQIVLNYYIPTGAAPGDRTLALQTRFGTSNTVTFRIGDSTPNVTSVTSPWQAGQNNPITITGTRFGTNPSITVSGPGVTGYSISSASDTQILANVTVDPSSQGGTGTVTVTSNGYNGSGFIAKNPGQSPNSPNYNVQIDSIPAPAPQILYFGNPINGNQPVTVGQRIELTVSIPIELTVSIPNSGVSTTTYSWTSPAPGTVIASFNGSAASGEQITELLSFTNPSLTVYWVTTGGDSPVTNSVSFFYCMANLQCSPTVTANFDVSGPTNVGVNVSTSSVNIFRAGGGDLMAFQPPAAVPGIKFLASATLPQGGGQGYQWVQLLNSDQSQFINSVGQQTCTSFNGPPGTPELDSGYPYGNGFPGTVFTTNVTNDSAKDSPNSSLPSIYGEWQRNFNATMYLRWIPQADGACTAGNNCTIPVPLGSITWGYSAGSINTLQAQNNGFNITTWTFAPGCPKNSVNPQFQGAVSGPRTFPM